MPLCPCTKEIITDLSEAPGHLGHHTLSLLMCKLNSIVSRLQSQMTIHESVGHSFKSLCYNHKHETKENNYLTCTGYQVGLMSHSLLFNPPCSFPVSWKANNPPSLQSACRAFMLEMLRTLSVELFLRNWQRCISETS